MVVFQAVAWSSREDDESYTIDIFGRTEDGQSVHVETPFEPYFFVKVPLGKAPPVISTMIGRPVIIKRKDLWGFQNSHEYDFAKLTFRNESDMRRAEWMCRNQKYAVYEANLNPVLRLMHRTGVQSTGWLETHGTAVSTSACSIDIRVGDWRSLKPVERDDIAPLRIASLDIECFSEDGSFPSAMKTTDVCFQVAITTRTYGRDEVQRKVLCVKSTDCPDSESFSCERDMLERFAEYMRDEIDPDIVTGWNIFGFDLEYLYTRTVLCGCSDTAYVWGRMRETPIELKTKVLASSALGSNTLKMVPMLGRYVFDMFQDIKREHKLESYSLNAVSTHFLNDKKIDMPVREMFSRFREGDSKKLGEVALYCLKDTELPHYIAQKTCLIENLIEMAKATWVPLSYLSERGQQIKVFSQVCRKARELGFMVPTLRVEKGAPETEYQGATVLEAQTGAYYMPITALDFASLYPSIMRAHNLCYSTWVDPKTPQFLNLPGVQYETFGPHTFAQNVPSLLPVILNELATFRKKAKKDMAKAEGTPMEAVYNGKQLAYKMSMNSVYGFTGASKGMLPLLAIASSVTMRGRQMIEETKNYVEANFPGAKVRYGDTDSVMVEFDVQGRKGQDAIEYSWQLGEQAAEQCTKLFKAPNDLELEKVYCPYFLYSKKRYAAKMYEGKRCADGSTVIQFKKIDIKGLQVVRRDTCPYVRNILKKLLTLILDSNDPRPAIEYARESAKSLLSGKALVQELVMSKQLGAEYKTKQPHVEVRNKIRARAPGSEPQNGDRVPFLITHGSGGVNLCHKAEDPSYVIENKVPIDFLYYFEHQLQKPVCDLLEPLVGQRAFETIFRSVEYLTSRSITSYFTSRESRETPDHP